MNQVEFSTWKSFEWYDGGGGGAGTSDDYLNWAQLKYFLGEIEEAKEYLMMYFKKEMKKEGEFCRECGRRAEKGTKISMCGFYEKLSFVLLLEMLMRLCLSIKKNVQNERSEIIR